MIVRIDSFLLEATEIDDPWVGALLSRLRDRSSTKRRPARSQQPEASSRLEDLDYDSPPQETGMNRRAFLTTAALTPILASAFESFRAQTTGGRLFYVGTYTNNTAGSKGIYAWRFDAATGKVTSLGLAAETDSPSWVVVHPNKRFLYA